MTRYPPPGMNNQGTLDRSRAARERIQALSVMGQTPVVVQRATPEWLTPLMSLLPPVKGRALHMRPPPHMIELTLQSLRNNALPPRPPAGVGPEVQGSRDNNGGITPQQVGGRKRGRFDNADSSDEEGTANSGGHGSMFRARQRARQVP